MSKDFKKLIQLTEDLQKARWRAVQPPNQRPFQEWSDAWDAWRRDYEPPPVGPQHAEPQTEAQQAESAQQTEPVQQSDLPTPKTPKQAHIQALACFLYPDAKVWRTIKTALMTREINAEWKRRDNKGDLATDKTVANKDDLATYKTVAAALGRSIP